MVDLASRLVAKLSRKRHSLSSTLTRTSSIANSSADEYSTSSTPLSIHPPSHYTHTGKAADETVVALHNEAVVDPPVDLGPSTVTPPAGASTEPSPGLASEVSSKHNSQQTTTAETSSPQQATTPQQGSQHDSQQGPQQVPQQATQQATQQAISEGAPSAIPTRPSLLQTKTTSHRNLTKQTKPDSSPCSSQPSTPQSIPIINLPPTQSLQSIHEHSSSSSRTQTASANSAVPSPPVDENIPIAVTAGAKEINPNATTTRNSSVDSSASSRPTTSRPNAPPRRKSAQAAGRSPAVVSFSSHHRTASLDTTLTRAMMPTTRKIWVKRPEASATLITISEDDLVDDVRETILRKYSNSLGKTFDSPDLNLRLCPRDNGRDRILGPEEHMGRTIDSWFPGGQDIHDAILIDVPRKTPHTSPRFQLAPNTTHTAAAIYYNSIDDANRPAESGEGYFPPIPSPHLPMTISDGGAPPHSIAVIGTGQIPTIPSPGGVRHRHHRDRAERPRLGRTHTASSALQTNGSSPAANNNHDPQHPPHPGPIPTHVLPKSPGAELVQPHRTGTPPPRIASPRASSVRPKKSRKSGENTSHSPGPGPSAGSVPPINVLIVEDNPINLKLLEAFMKRLKVRWKIAMNGRDAVKKWRTGGFHLVLMDIQLPVMNGLEATREIRRLERVNSIGVFSSTPSTPKEELAQLTLEDRLENVSLFKGPVIIVALTASSLQSDRHEALAAGCNDFLTKPVNFVWLERKVMEWGCMQALIDFDGWRQWKDIAQEAQENDAKAKVLKAKPKKARSSLAPETAA